MVTKLLSILPALVFALAASAQEETPPPPLAGRHLVLKEDGTPPLTGHTATMVIVPTAVPGVFVGAFYVDDGTGPRVVPGEGTAIVGNGSVFAWQNQRGTEGRIDWVGDEWRSEVLTGPNAGTVRRLVPQS